METPLLNNTQRGKVTVASCMCPRGKQHLRKEVREGLRKESSHGIKWRLESVRSEERERRGAPAPLPPVSSDTQQLQSLPSSLILNYLSPFSQNHPVGKAIYLLPPQHCLHFWKSKCRFFFLWTLGISEENFINSPFLPSSLPKCDRKQIRF